MTKPYQLFLARWARKLSWKEVAESFGTTWDNVFRSVKAVVEYGLKHRRMDGITAIGVDEIQYGKGQQYLTLVYQIDAGMRRLLFVGQERKAKTLLFALKLSSEQPKSCIATLLNYNCPTPRSSTTRRIVWSVLFPSAVPSSCRSHGFPYRVVHCVQSKRRRRSSSRILQ